MPTFLAKDLFSVTPTSPPAPSATDTFYLYRGTGTYPVSNVDRHTEYQALLTPENPCLLTAPFNTTRAGFSILDNVSNNNYGIRYQDDPTNATLGEFTLDNGGLTPTGDYYLSYRTSPCGVGDCFDVEATKFTYLAPVVFPSVTLDGLCITAGATTLRLGGIPITGIELDNFNTTTVFNGLSTAEITKYKVLFVITFYTSASLVAPVGYAVLGTGSSATYTVGSYDPNALMNASTTFIEYAATPTLNTHFGPNKKFTIFGDTSLTNYPFQGGAYTISGLGVLPGTAYYSLRMHVRNEYGRINNGYTLSNGYQYYETPLANLLTAPNAGLANPLVICN